MMNENPSWKKLQDCFESVSDLKMRDLFLADLQRGGKFSCEHDGLFLDYSKNRITDTVLELLLDLAHEADVEGWRKRLFCGEEINTSESQSALHVALRDNGDGPASLAAKTHEVLTDKAHLYEVCESIRSGKRTGFSNKPFRDIVNIGIGGSHLGPAMACHALAHLASENLRVFFITSVDACQISEVFKQIDPEKTLFIVTSKTFKTQETLANAKYAREWINSYYDSHHNGTGKAWTKHFLAITANSENAIQFGIAADKVLKIPNGVGGRFSLWSSVGLPLAILIGSNHFEELLAGARSMDTHFVQAPFASNMPVLLALLDIWYINFYKVSSRAVLPYDDALKLLPDYLQQLEMESNGKSVGRDGHILPYETAAVVWGKSGLEGQHTFYQLLHQGGRIVPSDFIITAKNQDAMMSPSDNILRVNFLAQTRALMCGNNLSENNPHRYNPGNQPSNALVLDTLSPFTLGLLLALYEHKVFVQAVIWGINPFDQWGVELGKCLATDLPRTSESELDSSTCMLMKRLRLR